MEICDPQVPKVYRQQAKNTTDAAEYQYINIKPYFPARHPNTMWIINRIRAGDATPLVNILKTREKMNVFFKYMYFQILDKPSLYNPKYPLDQPMFNEKAYLFLNIFAIALYFKCETIVRVLAPIRVSKIDNPSSYESMSDCSVTQYAAYVHDHSFGDLINFSIPIIMMRREAYFAIPSLFKFASWTPRNQFSIHYYRRNYESTLKFDDWLEYAWSLLDERPYTKIATLVRMLTFAAHNNFYLGDKVFFQPINSRPYNAPWVSPEADHRQIVVYRSYPRRILCRLFLHSDPLRIMPQVIPFVRVFQQQRFFVAQSTKAMNPEFRSVIQGSLEERFINLTPACNASDTNPAEYVEQNGHRTSIYDYDNIVALLFYFLVVAADRNVRSLKNSIIKLIMDIMTDTNVLFVYSREPAVNISYYLSHLVDGPFIQPNDLQHMLKNIPCLLLQVRMPDKCFPPFLQVAKSKYYDQQRDTKKLFEEGLPKLWMQGRKEKAAQLLMRYRVDVDAKVGVMTLDYCKWKNEYLESRLKLSMRTIHQKQQVISAKRLDQRLSADGGSRSQGWRASPPSFFRDAIDFLTENQHPPRQRSRRKKQDFFLLWTMEELEAAK